VLGRLRSLVLGRQPPRPEDMRRADPRWIAHETQRYAEVRRAAWVALGALLLFVGAGLWYMLGDGDTIADFAVATSGIVVGAAAGRFFRARAGRQADIDRAVTLGAIFYQEPQVLRGLLRSEVLDVFLQKLLRTVLRNDDLGDSLWRQTVSPLVDNLASDAYRVDQCYEVRLARLGDPLSIDLAGGERLEFSADRFWRFESELAFDRSFDPPEEELWLGVVFDPGEGPAWFADKKFALREYTALPPDYVGALCSRMPAPAVLQSDSGRWGRLREATSGLATRPDRARRLAIARELCRPRLEVAGTVLAPDEVALDRRGMAIRFPLDRALRARLRREGWARLVARLSVPLPMSICAFPAHFGQPTRGARVTFDYTGADVLDVQADQFFLVNRPFAGDRVVEEPGRVEFTCEHDEWVLPGAGVAFSWRLEELARRAPA